VVLESGLLTTGAFGSTSSGGKSIGWEVILVIGFVAGFSERLVPSIVDRISNQADSSGAASTKPTGPQATASK
jgi:hypothetical protein